VQSIFLIDFYGGCFVIPFFYLYMSMASDFFVFISYSRKDKKIANWLHSELESYAYPQKLVNIEQRPPHRKYIRPVFLDTKDMQVEERPFTDRIKAALQSAKFLILICSVDSAKSSFVDKEVKYFLNTHENNYSLVIPIFIDEVNELTIPNAILGTSIMQRHFPIYNSLLNEKSEANRYCFFQIVAYILGIDFSDIYNRYEESTKRKRSLERKRNGFVIMALFVVVVSLVYSWFQSQKVIEEERKLVMFEKDVFPAAVVYGYEENFLRPVINYLKASPDSFNIYILMPTSNRDLRHQDRVIDINRTLINEFGIDSISVVHLKTSAKRGSHIHRLVRNGELIPGIYLDFASTTTSFFQIADYKKKNEAYKDENVDDIIKQFTHTFIKQTNEKLEGDSIYLKFATSKEELVQLLQKEMH